MKFLVVLSVLVCLGQFAIAAEEEGTTAVKRQSSEDYFDGGSLDQPPETVIKTREPASSVESPYPEDETKQNAPENFKTKNMPIDQD